MITEIQEIKKKIEELRKLTLEKKDAKTTALLNRMNLFIDRVTDSVIAYKKNQKS